MLALCQTIACDFMLSNLKHFTDLLKNMHNYLNKLQKQMLLRNIYLYIFN